MDILIFEFLTLTFGHFGEVDAAHLEPRERETELNLRDMGGMRCDIWEKGGSFAKIVHSPQATGAIGQVHCHWLMRAHRSLPRRGHPYKVKRDTSHVCLIFDCVCACNQLWLSIRDMQHLALETRY